MSSARAGTVKTVGVRTLDVADQAVEHLLDLSIFRTSMP